MHAFTVLENTCFILQCRHNRLLFTTSGRDREMVNEKPHENATVVNNEYVIKLCLHAVLFINVKLTYMHVFLNILSCLVLNR